MRIEKSYFKDNNYQLYTYKIRLVYDSDEVIFEKVIPEAIYGLYGAKGMAEELERDLTLLVRERSEVISDMIKKFGKENIIYHNGELILKNEYKCTTYTC